MSKLNPNFKAAPYMAVYFPRREKGWKEGDAIPLPKFEEVVPQISWSLTLMDNYRALSEPFQYKRHEIVREVYNSYTKSWLIYNDLLDVCDEIYDELLKEGKTDISYVGNTDYKSRLIMLNEKDSEDGDMLRHFYEFAKEHGYDLQKPAPNGKARELNLNFGEALCVRLGFLGYDGKSILTGIDGDNELIINEVLGPIVGADDKAEYDPNDYGDIRALNATITHIYQILTETNNSPKVTYNLFKNRFPSIHPGFGGYWHHSTFGNALIFEAPHSFGCRPGANETPADARNHYMVILDGKYEELLDRINGFFKSYRENFATLVSPKRKPSDTDTSEFRKMTELELTELVQNAWNEFPTISQTGFNERYKSENPENTYFSMWLEKEGIPLKLPVSEQN
jgi:hypothetical protein